MTLALGRMAFKPEAIRLLPPTISKHWATWRDGSGPSHPRGGFPGRFSELAVFDTRFYIGVRCFDEPG
jgi:hypothetical protein